MCLGVREVVKRQEFSGKYATIELALTSRFGRCYEFSWRLPGQGKAMSGSAGQIEAPWLPRWDRAPRVGINVSGKESGKGEFKRIEMVYE